MTPPLLYVGSGGGGDFLGGFRMMSPIRYRENLPPSAVVRLDSGAFSDWLTNKRLSAQGALERQLQWEATWQRRSDHSNLCESFVSYDRVVTVKHFAKPDSEARRAVEQTIQAAHWLSERRKVIEPRRLILAAQGATPEQYEYCTQEILKAAISTDVLGLGGFAPLGKNQSQLPVFEAVLKRVLPLAAAHNIQEVHVFGVLWLIALARLVWMSDEYGISVTTDSTKPLSDIKRARRADPIRVGLRAPGYENVHWWRTAVSGIRERPEYSGWQLPLFSLN